MPTNNNTNDNDHIGDESHDLIQTDKSMHVYVLRSVFFECGFIETKHVDRTVFVWRSGILLMERNVALSAK